MARNLHAAKHSTQQGCSGGVPYWSPGDPRHSHGDELGREWLARGWNGVGEWRCVDGVGKGHQGHRGRTEERRDVAGVLAE